MQAILKRLEGKGQSLIGKAGVGGGAEGSFWEEQQPWEEVQKQDVPKGCEAKGRMRAEGVLREVNFKLGSKP